MMAHGRIERWRSKLLRHSAQAKARLYWPFFCRRFPLGKSECGIVAQWGIGDHLMVCGLAAEIGKKVNCEVVVAGNGRFEFIGRLFRDVKRYVTLPKPLVNMEVGEANLIPTMYAFGHFRSLELMKVCGYRSLTLLDLYRSHFGLPEETRMMRPSLPEAHELEEAEAILSQHGLPRGATALICMDSTTTPLIHGTPEFWGKLANQLRENGITPVANLSPGLQTSPIGLGLHLPLRLVRAFVMAAGNFIATRSGICDLVADLPSRKAILYPQMAHWGGALIDGATLSMFGFPNKPLELVVNRENEDAIPLIVSSLLAGRPAI